MKEKLHILRTYFARQSRLERRVHGLEKELSDATHLLGVLKSSESGEELAWQLIAAGEKIRSTEALVQNEKAEKLRYTKLAFDLQGEAAALRYQNLELRQENQRLNFNRAGDQGHISSLEQKIRLLEKNPAGKGPQSGTQPLKDKTGVVG
jgi:hypothetical protein